MQNLNPCPHKEEMSQLRAQVSTLEELLKLYEESAIEQEQTLQSALEKLQERAQQLEHAQTALQTLQAILDSMGDAVIVVDEAGRTLFKNPAAIALLNNSLDQPFDQPLEQSIHRVDTYEILSADGVTPYLMADLPLLRALRGESVDGAAMRIVDRNTRQSQWLSVNARPLKTEDSLTGAVAVFRDVNQRKQSEQILQQSNERFQQQTQLLKQTLKRLKETQSRLIHKEKMVSLGQTIAGIAHEINNPISFIHGNLVHADAAFQSLLRLVQIFRQTYPDLDPVVAAAIEEIDLGFLVQDIPDMLLSMKSGTERIREIVKSLRVFSHLDEADFKAVDIHQGIDSALMILQPRLDQQPNRAAIQINRAYGHLSLVECHASQLNQVFINLLSNAIDALPDQTIAPAITIRTQRSADCISIQITDNGTGIPNTIQAKIFDPFFTTKPVGKGMGLGLSICHQIIVEAHKGSLECSSQVGKGSQFVIKLPCCDRRSGAVQ